jgi:phosphoserine phosphatase
VLEALTDAGVTTAILTGGFERGVDRALDREGVSVDRVIANRLVANEGTLTGEVEGPLVEGTKDDALRALAADLNVPIEETAAVGDGANDRPRLAACGLSIGYDPKPAVRPVCELTVESMPELECVLETEGVFPGR